MEHTKLPWRIDRMATDGGAPIIVADECWLHRTRTIAKVLYEYGSEDPEVLSNAAFIVKACNCHDELLEALKRCRLELSYCSEQLAHFGRKVKHGSIADALMIANEIIAKCEGK